MNYIGIDGNVHSDSLMHWKYIKKIKSGSGWRYFYTPEEIRAYYKEEQGKANAEYRIDLSKENKRHRDQAAFEKKMYKDARDREKDVIVIDRDKKGNMKLRARTKSEIAKAQKKVTREEKVFKAGENFRTKNRKARLEAERKIDPVLNTAKEVASKPINEATKPAKQNIKDVKDYYKWQEKKANKQYKKEQKEIRDVTKGAREWNMVLSQERGYGENSRAKGKAISAAITAGSKGAKTISSIKRSATPKINTGKAIVNRTLKKELNAERKRREAARKRKTANRVASKTTNISKNISKALSTGAKKNETRKNRSGSKSYKMYNRW